MIKVFEKKPIAILIDKTNRNFRWKIIFYSIEKF